ncbi:hypothetical protein FJY63_15025, partial [Candidatus Sumerlaeota bacterium]|nr:hypothetical protein [Candidatus Sumerlaeota bacterium]
FKDPKKPTNEEKNLLKNCAADVENVFIVPGMSDNSYGEAVGGSVVINQGAKAPPGTKPPVPDGKTLAHENTHYWGLNAGDHTEGGKALPPENIGAADPSKASLKCTNKDILSRDQLDKLRAVFKQGGASQPLASGSGKAANESSGPYQVYPGSTGNEIGFAFTNYTTTRVPFAPMSGLRAEVVHSSPTFVLNFFPTSITLTPSSLAPGATATATFAFDVTASAVVGTGCFVELAVKSNTGDAFYFVAPLEAVAPPTAARRWELY